MSVQASKLLQVLAGAESLSPFNLIKRLQIMQNMLKLPEADIPVLIRAYGFYDKASALVSAINYLTDIRNFLQKGQLYHVKFCLTSTILCLRRHLDHVYCPSCDVWTIQDRVVEGQYEGLYHCLCHHIFESPLNCTQCRDQVLYV